VTDSASADRAEPRWPGERLGLPETGPRSIARFGRRLGALAIFGVAQILFLVLVNGSVGHLLLRMRVVPVRPARLGIWRPVVRTLLLCLAIPALIWDRDQRGLHDRAAGTMLVRV
jgi:hypothetical protein